MNARIIDGKARAARLVEGLASSVKHLIEQEDLTPGLAVVLVGHDPASEVYVRNKSRRALEANMASYERRLPDHTTQDELLSVIGKLNADPAVHGILVQLPLPNHIDARVVLESIKVTKDVDGFHPVNVGQLSLGSDALVPCTPVGAMMLLRETLGSLAGLHAVVVGRSNIVGKPVAQLLLAEDCTVTVAHSRSRDLEHLVAQADIVVAAVGRPGLIRGSWLKAGACVIDVGINRVSDGTGASKLVGDVAFDEAVEVAGAITPVPGGVGPMTIACLLRNTVIAACRSRNLPPPQDI